MDINESTGLDLNVDQDSDEIVKVGLLHSLSGTMAVSEAALVDAALMAIAEINEAGGILGKQIVAIVENTDSEPEQFAIKAQKLIEQDQVVTVFGCWTSASRKAALPIFEKFNAQLWYPVQYEGLETSKNIFYTGSCPNQQVKPAVNWLLEHVGNRFYLVGSDYVFPRVAHKIIMAQLQQSGGKTVCEEYKPLGNIDFSDTIANIKALQPDVVFNTLNGSSNAAFYQQYAAAGITAAEIPIMAVSVAEGELREIDPGYTAGHYASWSYFQSLNTPANQLFVQNFQARYGADRVTSDPIEAAYTQVYLWKQSVEKAGSFDCDLVRIAAIGQSFTSPSALVHLEANHHLWKRGCIGKALKNGQFEVIYATEGTIKPLPWLGVEDWQMQEVPIVIDLLREVPKSIQYGWEVTRKSQQLNIAIDELVRSNRHLSETQVQLIEAEDALRKVNEDLEARVEQRTKELLQEIKEREQVEVELRRLEEQSRLKAEQLTQTLSELKQTQTQLVQTEKMSSLGQLVAGIAHEINNPVNFIYGNLDHANQYAEDLMHLLLLYQRDFPNPTDEILEEIEAIDLEFLLTDFPKTFDSMKIGAARIREIVLSLRNFSRLDEAVMKQVDVHEGLNSTLMLLANRLKARPSYAAIEVVKNYGDLPPIDCYPGQLNQVFMNLLSNAIDAIEAQADSRQGEHAQCVITIETQFQPQDNTVMIVIGDNGPGIPPVVRDRMFDPFYTTKPLGQGTGLGLSISYQIIVEKHQGTIQYDSSEGQGTKFTIVIPSQPPETTD
ncbi:histidine kinase [Thalassoporum mexicanum PCC 7367]|uniref:urea ABC transporter substrate-binding protein n=1 Tax=Thalassoporum mexicanum TaxID=3457544 RepID=UPI00029FC7DA|nr:urea ABC transporter substrate-binding protein [Pseudanabaena sp. PCC 7367]AFY70403.1 histidine kinase [Pseudanabaena sp. PCC 7367]